MTFMQLSVSLPTSDSLYYKELVQAGEGEALSSKELIAVAWVGVSAQEVRTNRARNDRVGSSIGEAAARATKAGGGKDGILNGTVADVELGGDMLGVCDVQPLRLVYVEQVWQELIDYIEQVLSELVKRCAALLTACVPGGHEQRTIHSLYTHYTGGHEQRLHHHCQKGTLARTRSCGHPGGRSQAN
jgi:hypothetical protein